MRVLKGIFEPNRDFVTRGREKLHNELHNMYSSPTILRMIKDEMGRTCSTNGGKRNAYRILVEKPE
jgi:hypothetical protein